MSRSSNDLWNEYAQQWSGLRPPLRPSRQDMAFTQGAISGWLRTTGRAALSLLVMGVTPELCALPVGEAHRFVAIDKSPDMIAALWRPHANGSHSAVCGDWRMMPLAVSSIDIAVGDGSLSSLEYPAGYLALLGNLRRVLRPNGQCVLRCYLQNDRRETAARLLQDVSRGRAGGFHAFKLRLMMALQSDAESGVAVQDVWKTLHRAWPELHRLAALGGWPVRELLTMRTYRNAANCYSFPTRAAYREIFATAGFSVVQVLTPGYELGERCPTFVLEKTNAKAHG